MVIKKNPIEMEHTCRKCGYTGDNFWMFELHSCEHHKEKLAEQERVRKIEDEKLQKQLAKDLKILNKRRFDVAKLAFQALLTNAKYHHDAHVEEMINNSIDYARKFVSAFDRKCGQ